MFDSNKALHRPLDASAFTLEDAMPKTVDSLLRLDAVRERTALGRSTLYAMIQRGEFPAPIHIRGTRISAWPASKVDAWVARQIEEAA